MTKVARSEDIVPVKKVGRTVAGVIRDARQELVPKVTQKDLATKCNVKHSDITAYESGTAIPDNKLMTQMERILNVHLRGPNVGKVLKDAKDEKEEPKKSGK